MDYALPLSSALPVFELDHTMTPTDVNPLGVKGLVRRVRLARLRQLPLLWQMRWMWHTLRCLSGPKNCGRSFTRGTDSQEI